MQRFISFSGGVESTTMCILYGKGAKGIFVDGGGEHEKLYERIDQVEKACKQLHGDFEIIKLTGQAKHKGEIYNTLEDLIVAYKYMPSPMSRYCTRMFKVEPIDKFLSDKGECELMIGLNADEENSRNGNWGLLSNVKYSYPLVDDGLTRDDCEELLRQNNLHPDFPVYMSRGGCKFCFFKSEKEYKAMYFLNRKEFNDVMALEEKIQDRRGKFYSIMSTGKSMRDLAIECESQLDFDFIQMYQDYKKQGTSCGAFCRR